jgi:hypothetical protein
MIRGATNRAGIAYRSGAHEFTPGFSEVYVAYLEHTSSPPVLVRFMLLIWSTRDHPRF